MAWTFDLNFQLRDDQTTFGDLVVDTSAVDQINTLLCSIREGKPIDTQGWSDFLKERVYTNDEFSKVKRDFDVVRKDMKTMRELWMATTHHFDLKGLIDRADTKLNYVIGSKTWLQQYRETKLLATELFVRLKEDGCKSPLMQELEKRYGAIAQQSTREERVLPQLKKSYVEDVMNGDPNAVQKYVEAQKAAGVIDKNMGPGFDALMGSSSAAVVESTNVKNAEVIQESVVENEVTEDEPQIELSLEWKYAFARLEHGQEYGKLRVTADVAIRIGKYILGDGLISDSRADAAHSWLEVFGLKIYETDEVKKSIISIAFRDHGKDNRNLQDAIEGCIRHLDNSMNMAMYNVDPPEVSLETLAAMVMFKEEDEPKMKGLPKEYKIALNSLVADSSGNVIVTARVAQMLGEVLAGGKYYMTKEIESAALFWANSFCFTIFSFYEDALTKCKRYDQAMAEYVDGDSTGLFDMIKLAVDALTSGRIFEGFMKAKASVNWEDLYNATCVIASIDKNAGESDSSIVVDENNLDCRPTSQEVIQIGMSLSKNLMCSTQAMRALSLYFTHVIEPAAFSIDALSDYQTGFNLSRNAMTNCDANGYDDALKDLRRFLEIMCASSAVKDLYENPNVNRYNVPKVSWDALKRTESELASIRGEAGL